MSNEHDILPIVAKGKDKMKTARLDFDHGQYDDAVSRAYYAVYHMLTAVLFSRGQVYFSHAQTIGAFNRDFIKAGIFPKEFTRIIQKLFEDRQTGDYDVIFRFDEETARENIDNAEKIFSAIEAYLQNP